MNKSDVTRLQELVYSDTPEGFEVYYSLSRMLPLPRHVRDWVRRAFQNRWKGIGTVIYAFRGSSKTESITQALTSYEIGLHPEQSSLLIQVGDGSARDNTAQIARLIGQNRAFKELFPTIVPDKRAGWAAGGYRVHDTRFDYDLWATVMRAKDPTFLGLSYKSSDMIGKRPSLICAVDDINNEENTRSYKESDHVNKIVQGTIFPTFTPSTWSIFVGTPWTKRDVLAYVSATGEFDVIETPAYYPVDESVEGAQWFEEMKQWVALTWPDVVTVRQLQKRLRQYGSLEFARMMLLDLERAGGQELKREWLHTFPYDQIRQDWPVYIGVDYASSVDRDESMDDRDYCAIAWGRGIPGGGVVLEGGFRDRLSQGEAEMKLKAIAASFGPRLQLVTIETVSAGKEFYNLMLRNSSLPVFEGKPGDRSKGYRFQKEMAPLFEFSRVWVSDGHDSLLNEFTNEWVGFPLAPHDDTLDAVYWMLKGAVGNLMPVDETEGLPGLEPEIEESPFADVRDHRG